MANLNKKRGKSEVVIGWLLVKLIVFGAWKELWSSRIESLCRVVASQPNYLMADTGLTSRVDRLWQASAVRRVQKAVGWVGQLLADERFKTLTVFSDYPKYIKLIKLWWLELSDDERFHISDACVEQSRIELFQVLFRIWDADNEMGRGLRDLAEHQVV